MITGLQSLSILAQSTMKPTKALLKSKQITIGHTEKSLNLHSFFPWYSR